MGTIDYEGQIITRSSADVIYVNWRISRICGSCTTN